MSLIVVGLNHRTVPVELLERMTVPAEQPRQGAARSRRRREHLLEVVVLSTCNRIEVYARCTHFHPAVGDVRDFLAELLRCRPRRLLRSPLHVLRRSRGRAPLRGRGRARLDDRRRERDPRPGARGVAEPRCAKAPRRSCSRGCSGTRSSRASACAPRPVSAAIRCRSRRPRSSVAAEHLGTSRRREGARDRRRPDGDRSRVHAARRAASSTSGSPTARWRTRDGSRPSASAREAIPLSRRRRHARRRRRAVRRPPRRREVLVERATVEMVMACRGGRPLLDRRRGAAARRRSRRAARSTT